jgi:hypothetical protein
MSVIVRKPDPALVTASHAPSPAGTWNDAPARLVCAALTLSLLVLAARIVSVW